MKRELLENVKVQPYTSGDAIDREGYLSAVLGVSLGAATGTPHRHHRQGEVYRVRHRERQLHSRR